MPLRHLNSDITRRFCLLAGASAALMGRAAAAGPLVLGMAIGTTGAFASGEAPLLNGVQMAVDELNAKGGIAGQQIKLEVLDTGSQQTGAVNAFNRLLSDNPVAIMDTTLSGFVLSEMGTIKDEGLPVFTGAATILLSPKQQGSPNLFRIRTSDPAIAGGAARFALDKLGAKKIAVLRENNDYGKGWEDAVKTVTTGRSMALQVESFEGPDRDLTPQLLRIRDAGADVLIIAGDPPNFLVAIQQAKQLNITAKLILSNAGVLPSTLRLYQQGAAEGAYGTVDSIPQLDPATKDWADRYRAKFKIDPDYSAGEYYDGVMMLAAAIAAKGTDKAAIVGYLRGLNKFQGIGNLYTFADNGDGGAGVTIVQVKGTSLDLVTVMQ